jgi:hypothetical protein
MTAKNDEKGAKVESSFRAEKKPAVVMDKAPEPAPVDPTLCQCEGVQRRWDGDGVIEPGWYRCSVCGKKYR